MNDDKREVVITDIQIPFLSMVVLMVKIAIASIPAMIIITILTSIFMAIIGGIGRF